MEQEKVKLKQTAEQLAEKYEDTKDKQEELTKRQVYIIKVILCQQVKLPVALANICYTYFLCDCGYQYN